MYWLKDGEKLSNNGTFHISIHDSMSSRNWGKTTICIHYLIATYSGHIKVSSNGNLRIGNSRMEDAGLYECFTPSGLRGNVTIRFKLREKQVKKNICSIFTLYIRRRSSRVEKRWRREGPSSRLVNGENVINRTANCEEFRRVYFLLTIQKIPANINTYCLRRESWSASLVRESLIATSPFRSVIHSMWIFYIISMEEYSLSGDLTLTVGLTKGT